jgi:glycosyltransferase involved in cell wall biosynthesis
MKIIYITQHFPPEVGAAQGRAFDMSNNLAKLGHDVQVITAFPNHETNFHLFKREKKEMVKVLRTFRIKDTKKSAIRRLLNYFSFTFSSFLGGLFIRKADIVYATSPQLFQGISGFLLSRIHGAKFVFEVRDLWVDFAEILGQFKNKKLLSLAKKLERFLFQKADLIVVVTNGYKEKLLSLGIPENKIIVIPNGVNPSTIPSSNETFNVKKHYNIENKFLVLYAGNIGAAQGLETIINAAIKLKDNPHFAFMFVGDGVEKVHLKDLANKHNLTNVIFVDQLPKQQLVAYYKAADIGIVSLKNHPLFSITIPSKIFDYLSMSTPILLGVDGEAREIVEQLNGGYFFTPENTESFIQSLFKAQENPEKLNEMRTNMKDRLLLRFNRETLAKKLSEALYHMLRQSNK